MGSFMNCSLLLLVCFSLSFALALGFDKGVGEEDQVAIEGGIYDVEINQKSVEIARFAVDEHNKKENAMLVFARVVKAREQVVAGALHYLTLEAIDAGIKKLYEAKVWARAWLDKKELQEFKHTGDGESAERDGHEPGWRTGHEPVWRTVPTHDPVVQDAASHAVKAIQESSNCLGAYELLEIQLAKAQVIEDFAKFDLLLKLRRGEKEEKFRVEVHKNVEGTFSLNQMQEEH